MNKPNETKSAVFNFCRFSIVVKDVFFRLFCQDFPLSSRRKCVRKERHLYSFHANLNQIG